MPFGICLLSVIPVRLEPREQSEMVSQLLFGETCEIIENQKDWVYIRCHHDDYLGWLDTKMLSPLNENEFQSLNKNTAFVSPSIIRIQSKSGGYDILPGSTLYNINRVNNSFTILSKSYDTDSIPDNTASISLKEIALSFINAPYLWGGRSLFGIDCSGFSQVVYKIYGSAIPRDASQQVKVGETINFISAVKEGDLAFFDNEEEEITHVGMIINQNKIIHASGKVRIDKLDHQGIYNDVEKRYTHKLRIIKRILH